MNLNHVGSNMTEVKLKDGLTVLFSYSTPVAVHITHEDGTWTFYHTEKFWSRTTSRHITTWLPKEKSTPKPQEYFDNLIKEVA